MNNVINVFKYLRKDFAEEMMKYGKLRIGTLYGYRRQEHEKGIKDEKEGKKNSITSFPDGAVITNKTDWKID